MAKLACSAARIKSQHNARSQPSPTAGPLTAAIVGLVSRCSASTASCSRRCRCHPLKASWPAAAPRFCCIAARSPPAQKAGPFPVSTTARTRSSLATAAIAATNSARRLSLTAFRTSGRFSVMIAIRPSIVLSIVDNVCTLAISALSPSFGLDCRTGDNRKRGDCRTDVWASALAGFRLAPSFATEKNCVRRTRAR